MVLLPGFTFSLSFRLTSADATMSLADCDPHRVSGPAWLLSASSFARKARTLADLTIPGLAFFYWWIRHGGVVGLIGESAR